MQRGLVSLGVVPESQLEVEVERLEEEFEGMEDMPIS